MKMTPELPVDSIQKDCGVLVSTTHIQIVPHSADRSKSFLFRLSTAKFSLKNDERTYCRVYLPFYNSSIPDNLASSDQPARGGHQGNSLQVSEGKIQ